jgi:hypothetical protein
MIDQAKVRAILGSKYTALGAFGIAAAGVLMRDFSLTVDGLILLLIVVTNWLPLAVLPKNREEAERMAKEAATIRQTPVHAILGSKYTAFGAFGIATLGLLMRDFSLTVGGLILLLIVVTSWLPPTAFPKDRSGS